MQTWRPVIYEIYWLEQSTASNKETTTLTEADVLSIAASGRHGMVLANRLVNSWTTNHDHDDQPYPRPPLLINSATSRRLSSLNAHGRSQTKVRSFSPFFFLLWRTHEPARPQCMTRALLVDRRHVYSTTSRGSENISCLRPILRLLVKWRSPPAIDLGHHRESFLVTYYSFIVLGGQSGLPLVLVLATGVLVSQPRRHLNFLNIWLL